MQKWRDEGKKKKRAARTDASASSLDEAKAQHR